MSDINPDLYPDSRPDADLREARQYAYNQCVAGFRNIEREISFFAEHTHTKDECTLNPNIDLANAKVFDPDCSIYTTTFIVGHIYVDENSPTDVSYPIINESQVCNGSGELLRTHLRSCLHNVEDYEFFVVQLTPLIYGFYMYSPKANAIRMETKYVIREEATRDEEVADTAPALKSTSNIDKGRIAKLAHMANEIEAKFHADYGLPATSIVTARGKAVADFSTKRSDCCPILQTNTVDKETLQSAIQDFNKNYSRDYHLYLKNTSTPNQFEICASLDTSFGIMAHDVLRRTDTPTEINKHDSLTRRKLLDSGNAVVNHVLNELYSKYGRSADKLRYVRIRNSPRDWLNSEEMFLGTDVKECLLGKLINDGKYDMPKLNLRGEPTNRKANELVSVFDEIAQYTKLPYRIRMRKLTNGSIEFLLVLK